MLEDTNSLDGAHISIDNTWLVIGIYPWMNWFRGIYGFIVIRWGEHDRHGVYFWPNLTWPDLNTMTTDLDWIGNSSGGVTASSHIYNNVRLLFYALLEADWTELKRELLSGVVAISIGRWLL